jgi:hypothetical protein
MTKKQQMRWNRTTVQSFLDVRSTVLNDNLKNPFRHRYPGFRPTNDDQVQGGGRQAALSGFGGAWRGRGKSLARKETP